MASKQTKDLCLSFQDISQSLCESELALGLVLTTESDGRWCSVTSRMETSRNLAASASATWECCPESDRWGSHSSLLEDEVTQRGLKCPLCVSIFHQLPFLPMLESHDWAQVKWAGAPPSQTKESWEKATSVFQATTSGEKVLYPNRPLMWSKLLGQDEKGWLTEVGANRVLAAQFWKRPASGRRVPSLQMNALHC